VEGGVEPSVLLLGATTRHNPSLNRVPAAPWSLLGIKGNRRILWVSDDREPEIVSKVPIVITGGRVTPLLSTHQDPCNGCILNTYTIIYLSL
jgi:hypothetical protein